ncbi:hypothetical protein DAPPUDRAFT_334582 [Daphnia pulex]|uniref:Uncharacterized protein n=1 Tax=Daphnia pulex TaxID=6669 RepID=E9HVW6_DAPPU|nr:hypothetical protein DAPPUDRAFT_334582 [Daphnia pulex]|eukprot:EFX64115.1 hypothetical protein DAPPUDRAFT_334582 [Daphnia pulex]
MVCTEEQLREIVEFATCNPDSRVKELLDIRQDSIILLEQCDVDREMLKLLSMGRSPSFAFSCDVVHNWEIYRKLPKINLIDPGWSDVLGPTDLNLNKIYRTRLLDPDLAKELKLRMLPATASRIKILTLDSLIIQETETTAIDGLVQASFNIKVNVKQATLSFATDPKQCPSSKVQSPPF